MPSGFTLDQKKSLFTDYVLPMLKNDLRRVVDCTCAEHGKPGPGPNFTATMLCLLVCEVIGRLSSDPELDDDDATGSFLQRVAVHAGDERYRQAARALVVYFRHGIVHSFMPKQPSTVKGSVAWARGEGTEAGVCVEWLTTAEGQAALADLRQRHLLVGEEQGQKVFTVIPQVLYVDVVGAVDEFAQAITAGHEATLVRFGEGFEKWWGRATGITGQLDANSRTYLSIP